MPEVINNTLKTVTDTSREMLLKVEAMTAVLLILVIAYCIFLGYALATGKCLPPELKFMETVIQALLFGKAMQWQSKTS